MSECNCKFSLYFFVGMMNCRPGKPFPAEDKIGEFLDKSKNGVVFMSFGSVIKASVMPIENKDIILKVFSRFRQIKKKCYVHDLHLVKRIQENGEQFDHGVYP